MEMKIVVFRFADVRRELGVYVSAQRVEDPGEHQRPTEARIIGRYKCLVALKTPSIFPFVCARTCKERKLDDYRSRNFPESSNFKVLQVTQMGPYNILAALQESYDCHGVEPQLQAPK